MNPKNLIIFEYQILFEILNEIHKNLNFKVIQCDQNEFNNIKFYPKVDYLVVSKEESEEYKKSFNFRG